MLVDQLEFWPNGPFQFSFGTGHSIQRWRYRMISPKILKSQSSFARTVFHPLGRKCVKKFKNCWLASMCGAHYPCRYQLAVISIFIWCWLIHIDCGRTAKMLRDCQTPPHKSVFMTSQPPPDRVIDGWIACLKMIEKNDSKTKCRVHRWWYANGFHCNRWLKFRDYKSTCIDGACVEWNIFHIKFTKLAINSILMDEDRHHFIE